MTDPNDVPRSEGETEPELVTSLNFSEASTEEKLDDLFHLIEIYVNDVTMSGALPFWLYRQQWKRGDAPIDPAHFALEFLDWLQDNTTARVELSVPGHEPDDDLMMAVVAHILLLRVTEADDVWRQELELTTEGQFLKGLVMLGAVVAAHRDALAEDRHATFGSGLGLT